MNKDNVLNNLFNIIEDRKDKPIEGSYTGYLFEKGLDKILKKVGEESSEVIIAAKNEDKEELIKEICDLTYHIMVLMAEKQIKLDGIEKELEKRREKYAIKK
ncbi:phosphoribosyl-ATP diphosphatase [Clostridium botulinum]|nr:phosphoribosyl-ATP diphosphatase [Clostridium botulinum]